MQTLTQQRTTTQGITAGLAEPIRLIVTALHQDAAMALGDTLFLPARALTGTRALEIQIDRPSPWTAKVHDDGIIKACYYIQQEHDIFDVLDRFPDVVFVRDAGGSGESYLYTWAMTPAALAESILVLRDACLAVLACAYGIRTGDAGMVDIARDTEPGPAMTFAARLFARALAYRPKLGRAL